MFGREKKKKGTQMKISGREMWGVFGGFGVGLEGFWVPLGMLGVGSLEAPPETAPSSVMGSAEAQLALQPQAPLV